MSLNGFLAPFMVLPALTRLPELTKSGTFEITNSVVHPNASIACALAIGYMTFDLFSMIIGYKASVKANGVLTYHLYIWHHLLSILFWPVAVLFGSFTFFVNWFVLSELSSPFLGIRGAMLSLGTINTPLGMLVQLLFVISFFAGRIIVMPNLVWAFWNADWTSVPGWQATIARVTIPIPFALNLYWGVMICRSVGKVVFGGKKGKKDRNKVE
ncbi:TLC domain-containing protein [bacterium]|nr:TLC domain-containing protein [bacterium]MDC1215253.1 TLC domain-containing protein [bacterium]|tara:strand:+ start:17099 stop:17737 length:639 start_codon:yes stop_codon:yes gene_type:complete